MLNQAWYVIAKVGSRFLRPPKASIPADPSAIQIKSATSFDMLSRSSPLGACCFHCVWPCNLLIFAEIRPEVPQIHEIESSLSLALCYYYTSFGTKLQFGGVFLTKKVSVTLSILFSPMVNGSASRLPMNVVISYLIHVIILLQISVFLLPYNRIMHLGPNHLLLWWQNSVNI